MQCPLHSVKFETNFTICSKTLQFLQTHLLVLDISDVYVRFIPGSMALAELLAQTSSF